MKLTLEQKGPIQPPPVLRGFAELTSRQVQTWPGVTVATHWHLHRPAEVDGADFYVGADELGHLHLDGEVHLATSPELRAALVSAGLARRFAYRGHPYDGWVEASVRTPADAAHATWLFQLNYDRLCNVTLEILLSRITARTTRA